MSQLISVGQIIDQTLHLYQKHFVNYVRIGAWLLLSMPLFIVINIVFPLVEESFSGMLVVAGIAMLNTVLAIMIGYFVTNQLIFTTETLDREKKLETKSLRRRAWSRVGAMFVQGVLLGIMLVAAALLLAPSLIIFMVGSWQNDLGVVLPSLGMFLFFAGGVGAFILIAWFAVIFPFAPFSLLLEERGIAEGIRRAFALVNGRWWSTMLRVFIPKLTFGVIIIFSQIIISIIATIIVTGMAPMTELIGATTVSIMSSTIQQFAFTAVAAVTTPALIIADYYVFQNLVATRSNAA